MKLHYNSVSEKLLGILRKLMNSEVFKDFRLVGGTSLSLQRGHRKSIDIDLFTDIDYGSMPIAEIRDFLEANFSFCEGSESLKYNSVGYHLRIGNSKESAIKLDLFYTDKFIFPAIKVDGLRLADEREISAMKFLAIASGANRQKDYWDIHDMLEDYSLSDMISWSLKRHEFNVTYDEIIKGLDNIGKVPLSPEGIVSLKPLAYWELIVMDIQDELKRLKAKKR